MVALMGGEVDDLDGLEMDAAMALDAEGGPDQGSPDVPLCPQCHRPMDDIETMSEAQLLAVGQTELLRALVRSYRRGTNTHQEMAVLVRLLALNQKRVAEDDSDADDALPPPRTSPSQLPRLDPHGGDDYPYTSYDETEGG